MKAWVVALIAANLIVLAWWRGHLSPLWEPPGSSEREPLRVSRQMRPEMVRIEAVRPKAAAPSSSSGILAPGWFGPDAASAAASSASR